MIFSIIGVIFAIFGNFLILKSNVQAVARILPSFLMRYVITCVFRKYFRYLTMVINLFFQTCFDGWNEICQILQNYFTVWTAGETIISIFTGAT